MNKLYWVSAIINEEKRKPWLCSMSEGIYTIEKAKEQIEFLKDNHNVVSAWIDIYDENRIKETIFHECYIDIFGS